MPQTIYEVCFIFVIYACIGWCVEVAYAALELGVFVNRGFLNGPYCPIYGVGVLIVIEILMPLKDNLFILFIGSVLLTSVLEFTAGFILEKAFHNKWWDYSNLPFHIKGYVCLKFSVLWGLSCCFIIRILHPLLFGMVRFIPKTIGIFIVIGAVLSFAADFIVTVNAILKLNRRLAIIEEAALKLKEISDDIGEIIFERTEEVIEKRDDVYQAIEKKKAEYETWSRRYKELLEERISGHNRLLSAFPKMKSLYANDALLKLRDHWKKTEKDRKEQEK